MQPVITVDEFTQGCVAVLNIALYGFIGISFLVRSIKRLFEAAGGRS